MMDTPRDNTPSVETPHQEVSRDNQPGQSSFGPAPADAPSGSVLDTDSGVFQAGGSYSMWEQFSEQAFGGVESVMGSMEPGVDESLFGPGGEPDDGIDLFGDAEPGLFGISPEEGLYIPVDAGPAAPRIIHRAAFVRQEPETYDSDVSQQQATGLAGYDPLFARQWYLYNTAGKANINIVKAWEDFTGKGIKVAVCDDGVDYTHPDLASNYLTNMDYDAASNTNDGKPREVSDKHGTAVAGYVGAALNDYGIVGTAYESSIASLRSGSEPESGAALNKAVSFDVCSNSWTFAPFQLTPNVDTALQNIAENGRGGLGTVTTFCASNEREGGIMATYYSTNDTPYTLTVGAVNSTGRYADFSCGGPDILVTAPGEDVITTDREPGGYKANDYHYEDGASGTSFSTPIVSGVIALMLEANADLGFRDVHSILAYTAVKNAAMTSDSSKPWDWQTNGAANWNGGGMHASHDYGFGLVDATAAVRLAESWDGGQHTASNMTTLGGSATPALAIPDNTGASATSTVTIGSDIMVQQALVTLDISHVRFDDLEITLNSPNGTSSTLMYHPSVEGIAGEVDTPAADLYAEMNTKTFIFSNSWTFKTVMSMGEHGQGDWTITVKDTVSGDVGTFNSWSLALYGDTVTNDDYYVYTNEFSTVSGEAGRTTLTDTGGTDTINASAVTSASTVNLTPGSVSTIDGVSMTIAAGTVIENVHTGDGNDVITGNTAGNNLFGWRGNDAISGQAGDDLLFGGVGSDQLTGGVGSDLFYYSDANEGKDTITDFNHVDDGFNFTFDAFGQSSQGTLAGDHFFVSSSSVDVADACFIFESGTLWYDADGTGDTAAVDLAQVTGDAVQADDILFV